MTTTDNRHNISRDKGLWANLPLKIIFHARPRHDTIYIQPARKYFKNNEGHSLLSTHRRPRGYAEKERWIEIPTAMPAGYQYCEWLLTTSGRR